MMLFALALPTPFLSYFYLPCQYTFSPQLFVACLAGSQPSLTLWFITVLRVIEGLFIASAFWVAVHVLFILWYQPVSLYSPWLSIGTWVSLRVFLTFLFNYTQKAPSVPAVTDAPLFNLALGLNTPFPSCRFLFFQKVSVHTYFAHFATRLYSTPHFQRNIMPPIAAKAGFIYGHTRYHSTTVWSSAS